MKKILIFSGTTEGRRLAEILSENEIPAEVCIATEYGEAVMPELSGIIVHRGRLDEAAMKEFIRQEKFDAAVDATHPFAELVTKQLKQVTEQLGIPYLRLKRNTGANTDSYYTGSAELVQALKQTQGNILLTTGSKELPAYCKEENIRKRLYVRVLPGHESIELCEKAGLSGKQIIAMQGPFGYELNRAIIRQFEIKHLITKESGVLGGYPEKASAAEAEKIALYVIGNPEKGETGDSFSEICNKLSQLLEKKIKNRIALLGIGMGTADTLTLEAEQSIRAADYIFGAPRVLQVLHTAGRKIPYYLAEEILPWLQKHTGRGINIAVLFSGDSGFYSGCGRLYEQLCRREDCTVKIYPGISSISYLAAMTGYAWQDANIISIHGHDRGTEWMGRLLYSVTHHTKTFLLTSGLNDIQLAGKALQSLACTIHAGYMLSYPEQQLMALTPQECEALTKEGLYTCLIINEAATAEPVCCSIRDTEFQRGQVPMTKEEVRALSICKLKLHKAAIVYDIGSGTGSVAAAIAKQSPDIRVYAIEKGEEACQLIQRNAEQLHACNIEVIKGMAPEMLIHLPVPTHAFLGGCGGRLSEILQVLYQKNPAMRMVINAVSLETLAELSALKRDERIQDLELIQVQISRIKEAGSHQLMQAENPVFICSFQFRRLTDENTESHACRS